MRVSIVDRITTNQVLRLAHVVTIQRGGRVWFPCPRHDDKNPSAVVVGERGWRCHVCGAKGGVLGLTVAFGLAESHADAARFLEATLPQ